MAKRFDVSQGQVQIRSEFAEPQFGLFDKAGLFYQGLLDGLGEYGLKLSDMKLEWATNEQSLADYHLRCFLLNFGVTLRFRADRVDMFFNAGRVSEPEITGIVVAAIRALIEVLPDVSFRGHETEVAIHGIVADTTAADLVATFVRARPEQLGPSVGSGCVFYFGPEGERLSSNLTLDLSVPVAGGLYVRSYVTWDADKILAVDVPIAAASYLARCLGALGLERPPAPQ